MSLNGQQFSSYKNFNEEESWKELSEFKFQKVLF